MTRGGAGADEVDADVVVVGAGVAGVVAARQLQRTGRSVVLLERDAHTGGRVQTVRRDGWYAEHGGIFQTHGYHATRALLDEVGLLGDVRATETGFHGAVRAGGEWRFVDFGSVTGPLRTGVLGRRDKASVLRAAAPAMLTRRGRHWDPGDLVSVQHLDTHAATRDLTDRAATYFTAGPHEFLWGMPSERFSYAMLAQQLHVFTGELRELRGGTGRFLDALAADLDVRHGTTVTRVETARHGVAVGVEGASLPWRARAVVLACTADVAASVWTDAPAPVADYLRSIPYSRIDYVYLRTRDRLRLSAEGRPVGMEIVTSPEVDGTTLGGIYVADGWAGDGGLLLVTAAVAARAGELDDDTLADRLQADAEKLHPELAGQVTERLVVRHPHYTPVMYPGSVRRLAAVRDRLPHGRVDLAGDHMAAPWMEGAIRSAQQAADRVSAQLRAAAAR